MFGLQLIPASGNRADGHWSADDFDVVLVESGECVGRIYARTSASLGQRDWWWGLAFPHTLNARQPYYGLVALLWGVFYYRNRRRGETMVGDQKTRELFRSDDTQ